ncbi:GBF1 [Symbiodinium sp. CCMP2592]|nr:GBF1 [Symbiodinium sp. CCMP2592]
MRCQGGDEQVIDDFFWEGTYRREIEIGAYFDNVELVSAKYPLELRGGCCFFRRCRDRPMSDRPWRLRKVRGPLRLALSRGQAILDDAEWRGALDVMLQLWAMDLLPSHLSEFDDFSGTDGKPLESLCNIRPLFPPPAVRQDNDPSHHAGDARRSDAKAAAADSGDGFLESLARWFEDETRDDEEEEASDGRLKDDLIGTHFGARPGGDASDAEVEALPVNCTDPGLVHQKVKAYVARSGFVEVLGATGIAKVSPESLQCLAKALVQLSKPSRWVSQGQSPTTAEPADEVQAGRASWHDVADPVFCLELLTNLTCTPLPASHCLSHIWPLVSTHFEKLLQYVIAGNGLSEMQFIERLIVNTLRLCIRLIGNSELVPTLLLLTQHLSRLPAQHFAAHAERIACGTLVLVQEANLPHSGLCNIFTLLRRISEFPAGVGACSASIECLNFWLSDDQELSRLLSLQQFPELLRTLKAFASQNSTPASATALSHLSTLVPQMARGARSLPVEAQSQWRSLWVPTLQALADIARDGSQRCSAQAFVYLQRLLLECGTDLALPWEQLEFNAWKECLEQVLVPLLQSHPAEGADGAALTPGSQEAAATRQANAAQLVCRVLLTHMPSWLRSSPDGFPVLFLRILHVLVSEATTETAKLPLVESLKNLLLVISADPAFGELPSPKQGETLLEAAWGVVSPALPELRREVQLILDPSAEDRAPEEVAEAGAAKTDEPA